MKLDVALIIAAMRTIAMTREEWHQLDEALLAEWRKRFEGTEHFPVRT